jgi:peptide/nickel transport system substrate-binding protein
MKVSRVVALLAVTALLLAACGGGGDKSGNAGASGGSITIAIGSEPTSLDPQLKDDGGERAVNDNIYETLMIRSPDGKQLEPGLAAGEPTHPGGKDDVWEFKLRPNVKFSNGEPFNADAVVTSVKRIIAPSFKSEQAGFFSTITDAKKVDDLTVDIVTKGPDPILPSRMYWMKMVPAKASSDPSFAEKPVGTGPYLLKEWVRGDHIALDRNPNYWGEKPSINSVTYKFVAEGGTRLSGLLAGDYDLVTNLLPEDVKRAPKSAHVTGQEHPMIILNARGGITADPRVRQALNYAVNKDDIVSGIFGGLAKPDTCQVLSPSFFGYNQSLQPYPYDKAKAQALLQQAGATGKTIELVGETGRWLKDAETIQAVQNFWQEVGLKVNVRNFQFDEYLNRLFDQKNRADAIFVSSSNELLDADRQYSTYYEDGGIGSSNSDAQLKQLIDKARTELDEQKRQAMYNQAGKLACDNAYFLFLVNNDDIYGMSKRLDWQPRVDAKLLLKEMSVSGNS